jgi:hypothetical protein
VLIVKIEIDEVEYNVRDGENILYLCHQFEIHIPDLCYLKGLSPSGKCGVCVVETDDGKLELSCLLRAKNNLKIKTSSDKVQEARKRNIDRILQNHNISCHNCSKNGWCILQKTTSQIYSKEKQVDNFEGKLSKIITLLNIDKNIIYDKSKCIFCNRCIKFMNEVCDESLKFPEDLKKVENNDMIGNVVDVCPTSALNQNDLDEKNSILGSRIINTFDVSNIFTPKIKTHFVNNQIVKISKSKQSWIKDELRFIYKKLNDRKIPVDYNLTDTIDTLRQKIEESNNEKCMFIIGDNIDILSLFYLRYLQKRKKGIIICINDYYIPQSTTEDLTENLEKLIFSDYLIIVKPNSLSEIINVLSITKNLKNKTIIDKEKLNDFWEENKKNNQILSYINPCIVLFYNAFENDKNILEKINDFAKTYQEIFSIQLKIFVIPNNISSISKKYLKEYIPLSELFLKFNKNDLRFICQIGDTSITIPNKDILYIKNSVFQDDSENCVYIPSKHFLEDSCFYLNIFGNIIKTNGVNQRNLKSNREFLFNLMSSVFKDEFYDINEEIQNEIRALDINK